MERNREHLRKLQKGMLMSTESRASETCKMRRTLDFSGKAEVSARLEKM